MPVDHSSGDTDEIGQERRQQLSRYVRTFRAPSGPRNNVGGTSELEILHERHRFLWPTSDEPEEWSDRLARSYYDALYKEFALVDLSRYREGMIALRWRTADEVRRGKGEIECAALHCHSTREELARKGQSPLRNWEVDFAYTEHGESLTALVKVCVCSRCARRLNYRPRSSRDASRSTRSSSPHRSSRRSRR